MGKISHILLATDLTDRSERALQRATLLCRDGRAARFTLLHVVAVGLPPILAEQQLTGAEAFLAGKIAQLPSVGVATPASAIVRTGDPFSTIIGEGHRGKGGFDPRRRPGQGSLCANGRRHHGRARDPLR